MRLLLDWIHTSVIIIISLLIAIVIPRLLKVQFTSFAGFKKFMNEPTCYRNPEKPSRIDLSFISSPRSLQNTQTIETG